MSIMALFGTYCGTTPFMKTLSIKKNPNFVGRKFELSKLHRISDSDESAIIIIYGRSRIGKTELIEQGLSHRNLLKFEGIAGLGERQQIQHCFNKLAEYTDNNLQNNKQAGTWLEFFEILSEYTKTGVWTIYLEELQWLANYHVNLINELKYVWDNNFRYNSELLLVLCGSAPSFMIDKVVHSKALYNRSQHEINLKQFSIAEIKEFMPKRTNREIFDIMLSIGGIPEYLKKINKDSSVFLGLCNNSFLPNAFFVNEYEKIFTSSLADNKHYKQIIDILSGVRFADRNEILKKLKAKSSGKISYLLLDLEKCGFIEEYHPYTAKSTSKLTRYAIADNYLQFYMKFIVPIKSNINNGDYINNPQLAIKTDVYYKWLGFAFERWCRKNHRLIASVLGFSRVLYKSGSYFSRTTDKENTRFQIDLIFERADNVLTICEVKYTINKVPAKVINDVEKKISLLPRINNKTIHKVLISCSEPEQSLKDKGYFDEIITIDDLMGYSKFINNSSIND